MDKTYYRIVLIGNGFDKALGLKTSYSEFILDLFKKVGISVLNDEVYNCDLINAKLHNNIAIKEGTRDRCINELKSFSNYKDVISYIRKFATIYYHYNFFEELISRHQDSNWVDIEQFYYESLKTSFSIYRTGSRGFRDISEIENLNECMDKLTFTLNEYIKKEQNSIKISYAYSHLSSLIDKINEPLTKKRAALVSKHNRKHSPNVTIFVNFNYTNTIEQILDTTLVRGNNKHLYLHGSVNDVKNPIIFGYGDDTDDEYRELELEGVNELLRKIKSFQYPRTHNYHNLLNYLSGNEFDVFIVGHSCGLSDRTLLKTIFEHPNCLAIQNFHYKGEPEDFDKRMEISRHFNDKVLMRERVLPFDELAEIPQKP